jgi:hypothetical protein
LGLLVRPLVTQLRQELVQSILSAILLLTLLMRREQQSNHKLEEVYDQPLQQF